VKFGDGMFRMDGAVLPKPPSGRPKQIPQRTLQIAELEMVISLLKPVGHAPLPGQAGSELKPTANAVARRRTPGAGGHHGFPKTLSRSSVFRVAGGAPEKEQGLDLLGLAVNFQEGVSQEVDGAGGRARI
jgi:hypothetical protein